jgi:transcriptional antiterminator Rof (Rho-off)
MGHRLDVGDIIDMIEESVMLRRPIVVELRDGRVFEDRARDIYKWNGEDQVAFHDHELTPLHAISAVRRARPPVMTYDGRRMHSIRS